MNSFRELLLPLQSVALSRRNNFAQLRELMVRLGLAAENTLLAQDFVKLKIAPACGSGGVEFVRAGKDLYVVVGDVTLNEDFTVNYVGEDWMRFHFMLHGNLEVTLAQNEARQLTEPTAHFLLQPSGAAQRDVYRRNQRAVWVEILCRKEHWLDTFSADCEWLPAPLRHFLTQNEAVPFLHEQALSARMHQCINTMFERTRPASLRPLYLKAKAHEIVYAYLDSLLASQLAAAHISTLSPRDIKCLQEAWRWLEHNAGAPLSLAKLSRQIGINRSKLSTGFRQLFGVSMVDFCRTVRLNKANALLRDTELPIGIVAERCGYVHTSSFSAAFKSHFGYSPKAAKQPTVLAPIKNNRLS